MSNWSLRPVVPAPGLFLPVSPLRRYRNIRAESCAGLAPLQICVCSCVPSIYIFSDWPSLTSPLHHHHRAQTILYAIITVASLLVMSRGRSKMFSFRNVFLLMQSLLCIQRVIIFSVRVMRLPLLRHSEPRHTCAGAPPAGQHTHTWCPTGCKHRRLFSHGLTQSRQPPPRPDVGELQVEFDWNLFTLLLIMYCLPIFIQFVT